jgi:hypothetical protein
VRHAYYEAVLLVERVHRHFLEVVKSDLDRAGIQDINNIQALILYNIGSDEMTVGELTARGYYLGSNVSYNVKKMAENQYLLQERSRDAKEAGTLLDRYDQLCRGIICAFNRPILGCKSRFFEKVKRAYVKYACLLLFQKITIFAASLAD